MAGGVGVTLDVPSDPALLFGEDQGRYVIVTADPEAVMNRVRALS